MKLEKRSKKKSKLVPNLIFLFIIVSLLIHIIFLILLKRYKFYQFFNSANVENKYKPQSKVMWDLKPQTQKIELAPKTQATSKSEQQEENQNQVEQKIQTPKKIAPINKVQKPLPKVEDKKITQTKTEFVTPEPAEKEIESKEMINEIEDSAEEEIVELSPQELRRFALANLVSPNYRRPIDQPKENQEQKIKKDILQITQEHLNVFNKKGTDTISVNSDSIKDSVLGQKIVRYLEKNLFQPLVKFSKDSNLEIGKACEMTVAMDQKGNILEMTLDKSTFNEFQTDKIMKCIKNNFSKQVLPGEVGNNKVVFKISYEIKLIANHMTYGSVVCNLRLIND